MLIQAPSVPGWRFGGPAHWERGPTRTGRLPAHQARAHHPRRRGAARRAASPDPGLRREEVAHLAYISTEYYTRLEQARGPHPSREVLAQLARALRLSDAERDHLHHLAGTPPGPPPGPSREVRQSIVDLLDRLPQAAAIVLSATYEVIAWNDLAAALMEDFSALPRRDRNLVRRRFLEPKRGGRWLYSVSDADAFARSAVQHLRAAAARYPDDPEMTGLVEELLAGSEEFARLWAAHEVAARPDSPQDLRPPRRRSRHRQLRRPGHRRPRPARDHLHRRTGLAVRGGVPAAVGRRYPTHGHPRLSRQSAEAVQPFDRGVPRPPDVPRRDAVRRLNAQPVDVRAAPDVQPVGPAWRGVGRLPGAPCAGTQPTPPSTIRYGCSPTPAAHRPPTSVDRAHDQDVLVAALAGSARHARKHQEAGIDIVVAQGTRPAATPARSPPWCSPPRSSRPWTRCPYWRPGGSERPAGGGGTGTGSPGSVAGLPVADHHRSGHALARPDPEAARRRFRRHRPLARPHRQARAPAAHRVDRRLGRPRRARHPPHATAGTPRRRGRLDASRSTRSSRCWVRRSARSSAG
ncbi:hypothetical protein SALBM311S_03247 [Streptomyces alboniger]